MHVQRLNNRFVVECQHCLGTTACQHAIHFNSNYDRFDEIVEHWLMCQRCGEGYHTIQKIPPYNYDVNPPYFDTSALHRPVCAVCEGRGFFIS